MLKKMNLQWRLISSFSFVGTIVFLVGLVGWNSSWKLSNHIETLDKNNIPSIDTLWSVNEAHTRITGLQKFLRNVDMTKEERQSILDELEISVQRLEEEYKNYQATPVNNEEEATLRKDLEVLLNKWRKSYSQYIDLEARYNRLGYRNPWKRELELLSQGQANSPEMENIQQAKNVRNQLIAYTNNRINPQFKEVDELIFKTIKNNEDYVANVRKLAEQDVIISNVLISTGVILGPTLSILFGIMIAQQISNPVNRVVVIAEQISTGNLTADIEVKSHNKDEINQLMASFFTMIQKLNNLLFQIQNSATKVSLSTTKIAASGKQLEASITEQLASTNQVTAATKEISTTSKQLVKTVEEVTAMSKNTTMAASDSQKYLQQMEATMKQLLEATNSIAGRLGVISEKANNINNIVVAITKVADQTNLLSFNAAIEAEKAGEYGLGFAVVAREIRRLADQTAVATVDIEQMVKQMQSSVSTGVMEMDKFAAEVSRSVESVGEISSNLGQIIEEVQELTPRFELVNQGMESQAQGAQQISEAMSQLSQNSRQTAATLQEINHAITLLNEVNQGLNQEIRQFKLSAVVEKSIEDSQVLFQR